MSVHCSLVKPTLQPYQTMDGSMLNRIYKDRIVYVRPSVELRSQMVIFVGPYTSLLKLLTRNSCYTSLIII